MPSLTTTTADLEALAKMDAVVRNIRAAKASAKHYAKPERFVETHALVAKSLGAMHTVATFSELSPETQRHPDVQRRMWAALPDIHDATMSMADRLDGLSAEERRRVDERVRSDDGLPMRIVEVLDDEASQYGIPDAQRFRMRTIAMHVAWRLKSQGAGAVLDDLVGKIDRVVARQGADAELQRAVAAKVADAQLFGFPPAGDPSAAPTSTEAPTQVPPPASTDDDKVLRARFRTHASEDAIRRISCGLQARLVIEGKERPLDLRVVQDATETSCGAQADPIRGVVRLRRDSDAWDVLVEIDVPDGITPAGREELRGALRDVGGELRRRVLGAERTVAVQQQQQQQQQPIAPPELDKPKSRSSSKVLTASAIVWGIGLGTAAIGGLMIGVGNRDPGVVIGGAFVLTLASLLALAGIITLIIAGAMYSAGN